MEPDSGSRSHFLHCFWVGGTAIQEARGIRLALQLTLSGRGCLMKEPRVWLRLVVAALAAAALSAAAANGGGHGSDVTADSPAVCVVLKG